jgi:GWxTD domain-containing protein
MKINKLISAILITLIFSSTVPAQRKDMSSKRRKNMFGRDLFAYRYYNFADSTDEKQSRMEFHVGIVNDLLTFIKMDEGAYKARYEVAIVIYNKKKEPIIEESVSGRVTTDSYAETNSRRNAIRHTIKTKMAPGNYKGLLQLIDLESDESLSKELEFTAKDFGQDKIRTSDILFIDKIDTLDAVVSYKPNLAHVFDNVKSAFSAYIEIYPASSNSAIDSKIDILDAKGNELFSANKHYESTGETITAIIPFRDHLKKPGEYRLVVTATAGDHSSKAQRMFSVIWGNVPLAENNLDMAVEQLALVAHKSDVEAMRSADGDIRKQLFDAYWQKRDPSPNTQKNELEDEFFRRVDFTNRNFAEIISGRSGWKTDRGKIYIVYGPPEQVNNGDGEVQKPSTEIWYYNRLNRKYFFSDRSGDGVFRLVKVE